MRRLMIGSLTIVLGLGCFLLNQPAEAVITAEIQLKQVLQKTQFIFTAKVETFDAEKRLVVLELDENLKGKMAFEKFQMTIAEDPKDPKRENNKGSLLLKRLAVDVPVIFFADEGRSAVFDKSRDEGMTLFMCSNGTWVQFGGNAKVEGQVKMPIRFHHFEPYLRRTFKGTTAELRQVVIDGLAGKKDPPVYDAKEPPGLGPEIMK